MTEDAVAFGVVVVDRAGTIRFQSGCGADPRVQQAVASLARTAPRRMQSITIADRRLVVLARHADDASVFFVHESSPDESLFDFVGAVDFAHAVLNHFVNSPYEGMTVVDDKAALRYMSPVHERFFGLEPGDGIGKPVTEVIEHTRLHEVVRTGRPEFGRIQEMRGVSRVVSRVPIRENGAIVGAIGQVVFKGPEQLHELSRELTRLKTEVAFYKRELSSRRNRSSGLDDIVGNSAPIRQLKDEIVKVAPLDIPVLLVGESGTGKELAAHAIQALSPRRERPMVLVNAAALPATLVESELFGYEPGAFTGAERKGRKGKFELADRGTLFLDEIGDMPVEMQAKLLRVLQDGSFERVGGDQPRFSDFRLVAASNRDLKQLIDTNRFRLDLYYRISGVVLQMPPLRDRLDDIPALVQHFLKAYAARHDGTVKRVRPEVFKFLRERAWPGNVRQLQHEVEQAAVFAEGDEIAVRDFRGGERTSVPAAAAPLQQRRTTIHEARNDVELSLIREAMARHNGNKKRVARELGISRSYLYKLLRDPDGASPRSLQHGLAHGVP